MPSDTYVRYSGSDVTVTRRGTNLETSASEGLVFVDLETAAPVEDVVKAFLSEGHQFYDASVLLFRWSNEEQLNEVPSSSTESVQQWVDVFDSSIQGTDLGHVFVGVIMFAVSKRVKIVWATARDRSERRKFAREQLLDRCRRLEIKTLIDSGAAIWRPKGYHYEMPSGQHAGAFIRLGDAIRSPRDARVLATWILPLVRGGTGFILDSSTLVPIVSEVHSFMRLAALKPGPVEVLDELPRNPLDVGKAVRVAFRNSPVIAMLSVNASGQYRSMIHDSLTRYSGSATWALLTLVDKTGNPAWTGADPEYPETRSYETWYRTDDPSLRPRGYDECLLCLESERAALVKVDPRSFSAMVLPNNRLMMPDFQAARDSRSFWQLADKAGALQHFPSAKESDRPDGSSSTLGFGLDLSLLTEGRGRNDPDTGPALSRQVGERLKGLDETWLRKVRHVDAILYNQGEAHPGFDELLQEIYDGLDLNNVELIGWNPTDSAPAKLQEYERVLVLSLGTVTGFNLRNLLLAAVKPNAPRDAVLGLVIHARPTTQRQWENMASSFSGQLRALWLTYLPWWSPLEEEANHLRKVGLSTHDLSPEAGLFKRRREQLCSPMDPWAARMLAVEENPTEAPNPEHVLWGISAGGQPRVRGLSLYGHEVQSLTTLVAVGSAMQHARMHRQPDDPRWSVFEMPAITRSYYDGIIVASVLRWLARGEAWWGSTAAEAEAVVGELIARTTVIEDQLVLFGELLLAGSQGKLPEAAVGVAYNTCGTLVTSWTPEQQAPVVLGAALCRATYPQLGPLRLTRD